MHMVPATYRRKVYETTPEIRRLCVRSQQNKRRAIKSIEFMEGERERGREYVRRVPECLLRLA